MEKYAHNHGHTGRVERWDWAYWSEKLRLERYNIDDEALRPYMPLEKVKEAVLGLATKLYGLTFTGEPRRYLFIILKSQPMRCMTAIRALLPS
ncbi:MAG: M3 family metallopeptidase [Bacteroidales bacterium]|nr:M3 family metallopeptidase [Bacteroidales bacterium]